MELKNLYQFVLILIMVGMIIGIGVVSLDKMTSAAASTYTTSSATLTYALGNATLAIRSIATNWLGLIVIIVILAIIIGIMIKSFAGQSTGRQ